MHLPARLQTPCDVAARVLEHLVGQTIINPNSDARCYQPGRADRMSSSVVAHGTAR